MSDYIDTSIEHVTQLDPEEVASHQVGMLIGTGGSVRTHTFYRTNELHLALKVPRDSERGTMTKLRATSELAIIDFLTDHSPELRPLVPAFIGMVAVATEETSEPLALITEDASQGNALKVWPQPASRPTLDSLARGFAHLGTFNDIFDDEILGESTAFDVGGNERLLDFTPAPLNHRHYMRLPGHKEAFGRAWERSNEWTIEVSPNSPLAQSILKG